MYFKKKESWFQSLYLSEKIALILLVTGVLAFAVFLFSKIHTANRVTYFYFLPLLLGLVFELKSITKKWSTVAIVTVIALLCSLRAFPYTKMDDANLFEQRLQVWLYFFLAFFVAAAFFAYIISDNVKEITEGITLLFTIAINYWILANNYWSSGSSIFKILIIINWIASAFAIYHALTYNSFGKVSRVLLSLWFAVIGLVLAADNCYQLYHLPNIHVNATTPEGWILFFQYFLLGISGIYIVQNLLLVCAYFFPVKGYREMLSEVHDVHLRRFSKEQVYVVDALIVIILSVTLFTLNYIYQFVPVNFMIWATVSIMSLLLYIVHKIIA